MTLPTGFQLDLAPKHPGAVVAFDWDKTRSRPLDLSGDLSTVLAKMAETYVRGFIDTTSGELSDNQDLATFASPFVPNIQQWQLALSILRMGGVQLCEGSQRLAIGWAGETSLYNAYETGVRKLFPETFPTIEALQTALQNPQADSQVAEKLQEIQGKLLEAIGFISQYLDSNSDQSLTYNADGHPNFFIIGFLAKLSEKFDQRSKRAFAQQELELFQTIFADHQNRQYIATLCNYDKGLLLAAVADAMHAAPQNVFLVDDDETYRAPTNFFHGNDQGFIHCKSEARYSGDLTNDLDKDNAFFINLCLNFLTPEAIYVNIEASTADEAIKQQFYRNPVLVEALKDSLYSKMDTTSEENFRKDLEQIAIQSPAVAKALIKIYTSTKDEEEQRRTENKLEQLAIEPVLSFSLGKILANFNLRMATLQIPEDTRNQFIALARHELSAVEDNAERERIAQFLNLPLDNAADLPAWVQELNTIATKAFREYFLKPDDKITNPLAQALNFRERLIALKAALNSELSAQLKVELQQQIDAIRLPPAIPVDPTATPIPQIPTFQPSPIGLENDGTISTRKLEVDVPHLIQPIDGVADDPKVERELEKFNSNNFRESLDRTHLETTLDQEARDLKGKANFTLVLGSGERLIFRKDRLFYFASETSTPFLIYTVDKEDWKTSHPRKVLSDLFSIIKSFIPLTTATAETLQYALLHQSGAKTLIPTAVKAINGPLVEKLHGAADSTITNATDESQQDLLSLLTLENSTTHAFHSIVATIKSPREICFQPVNQNYQYVITDSSQDGRGGENFDDVEITVTSARADHLPEQADVFYKHLADYVFDTKIPNGYRLSPWDVRAVEHALQTAMEKAHIENISAILQPIIEKTNQLLSQNDKQSQDELRDIICHVIKPLIADPSNPQLRAAINDPSSINILKSRMQLVRDHGEKVTYYATQNYTETGNIGEEHPFTKQVPLSGLKSAAFNALAVTPAAGTTTNYHQVLDVISKPQLNTNDLVNTIKSIPTVLKRFTASLAMEKDLIGASSVVNGTPRLTGQQVVTLVKALPTSREREIHAAAILQASRISNTRFMDIFRNVGKEPGFRETFRNWRNNRSVPDYADVFTAKQLLDLIEATPANARQILSVKAHRDLIIDGTYSTRQTALERLTQVLSLNSNTALLDDLIKFDSRFSAIAQQQPVRVTVADPQPVSFKPLEPKSFASPASQASVKENPAEAWQNNVARLKAELVDELERSQQKQERLLATGVHFLEKKYKELFSAKNKGKGFDNFNSLKLELNGLVKQLNDIVFHQDAEFAAPASPTIRQTALPEVSPEAPVVATQRDRFSADARRAAEKFMGPGTRRRKTTPQRSAEKALVALEQKTSRGISKINSPEAFDSENIHELQAAYSKLLTMRLTTSQRDRLHTVVSGLAQLKQALKDQQAEFTAAAEQQQRPIPSAVVTAMTHTSGIYQPPETGATTAEAVQKEGITAGGDDNQRKGPQSQ